MPEERSLVEQAKPGILFKCGFKSENLLKPVQSSDSQHTYRHTPRNFHIRKSKDTPLPHSSNLSFPNLQRHCWIKGLSHGWLDTLQYIKTKRDFYQLLLLTTALKHKKLSVLHRLIVFMAISNQTKYPYFNALE